MMDGIPGSLDEQSVLQSGSRSNVSFDSGEYICMMVCHSIAIADQLSYDKFMRKLKVRVA